jgi:DNA-binding MarR family transcriptional regulator
MSPLRLTDADAASLRALVLLQRYSLGLNQVVDRALGDLGSDNADIQLLLVVESARGVSPSELVATLRRPRSTVSRGLARLLSSGLVERRPHAVDRRRAELHLTSRGRERIARFEQSMSTFFSEGEPLVKEVMLLLGRDPERLRRSGRRPGALELADRMREVGQAWADDLLPRLRRFGEMETVDRYALAVLAQGWTRPTWLADELRLSPAGTTSMLERLEGLGLAMRENGVLDTDRRAVVVDLTPRGRAAARILLDVFRAHQEQVLDVIAPTVGVAHPGDAEPAHAARVAVR